MRVKPIIMCLAMLFWINCNTKPQNRPGGGERSDIKMSASTGPKQAPLSPGELPSNPPGSPARGVAAPEAAANRPPDGFIELRNRMVGRQIENRGIKDKNVLDALRKVPRHLFVPEQKWDEAYADHPVPIGNGQTISQPYIVGLMTELLELKGADKVLEIGTGSGYQAAILAELCGEVYSIEIIESLGKKAEKLLQESGYRNIRVKIGDGYLGWPENAPFDGIIVTCAPDNIPGPLLAQLAEGGRMVIPVGSYPHQTLKRITKRNGKLNYEDITGVLFVPMTGKAQEKK